MNVNEFMDYINSHEFYSLDEVRRLEFSTRYPELIHRQPKDTGSPFALLVDIYRCRDGYVGVYNYRESILDIKCQVEEYVARSSIVFIPKEFTNHE